MNAADAAIQYALAQVGKPYVWGATGPNAFDCSGLVQAAYRHAGVILPRVTYAMLVYGSPVSQSELMPGDLVFPDAGHVQMYLGNGQIVEAPHTGANVRVMPIGTVWRARRVTSPGAAIQTVGFSTVSDTKTLGGSFSGWDLVKAFFGDTSAVQGDLLRIGMFLAGGILILITASKLVKES